MSSFSDRSEFQIPLDFEFSYSQGHFLVRTHIIDFYSKIQLVCTITIAAKFLPNNVNAFILS